LVFVDACEDSIMANDVAMPLIPLVVLVEVEELEEASLNVNAPNGRSKNNRLKEWCALESIVWHGMVDSLLIHML